jgi:hypothetical protein
MLVRMVCLLLYNLVHPIDSVVIVFKTSHMSLEQLVVLFDHLDPHPVCLTLSRQAFILLLEFLNIPL